MLGMAVKGTKFCPHSFVVLSFPWTCRLLQNKIGKKCTANHDIWGWAEIVPVLWLYTCNPNCIHATKLYTYNPKFLQRINGVISPTLPLKKMRKGFFSFFNFFVVVAIILSGTVTHRCSYSKTNTQTQTHTHAQMLMFTHTPIHKSKHTVTADNTEKLY